MCYDKSALKNNSMIKSAILSSFIVTFVVLFKPLNCFANQVQTHKQNAAVLIKLQHLTQTYFCCSGSSRWSHPPDRQRPSDSPSPEERYRHLPVPRHGTWLYPNLTWHNLGSCTFSILLSLQSTFWCPCAIRPPQRWWVPNDQSETLVPGLHATGGPPKPEHSRPDLWASLGTEECWRWPSGEELSCSGEGHPASGPCGPPS